MNMIIPTILKIIYKCLNEKMNSSSNFRIPRTYIPPWYPSVKFRKPSSHLRSAIQPSLPVSSPEASAQTPVIFYSFFFFVCGDIYLPFETCYNFLLADGLCKSSVRFFTSLALGFYLFSYLMWQNNSCPYFRVLGIKGNKQGEHVLKSRNPTQEHITCPPNTMALLILKFCPLALCQAFLSLYKRSQEFRSITRNELDNKVS